MSINIESVSLSDDEKVFPLEDPTQSRQEPLFTPISRPRREEGSQRKSDSLVPISILPVSTPPDDPFVIKPFNPLAGHHRDDESNDNKSIVPKAAQSTAAIDLQETKEKAFSSGVLNLDEPYGVDADYIFNIIERKDIDKLNDKIGGIENLFKLLCTDRDYGIKTSTIEERIAKYGKNELIKKEPARFIEFLMEAFKDPMIILLCICAVVSIFFGIFLPNPYTGEPSDDGWIEGFAIIVSILVVTLTGSISNYKKAKRFEEMEYEQSIQQVQVFREGQEVTINSDELVVGDILVIEGGTLLSVDGILVHGNDLKTNETSMTGEHDIIEKSLDEDPFFISGTQIEEGSGRMLVVAVGMESIQGRLKETTDEEGENTPLQDHLERLASMIAKIGIITAIILFLGLTIKEIIVKYEEKNYKASIFLRFVIIAVTIVVVAVPEGLPLAVTISLAYSMKSMMDDQCLVRVLSSCETMGAATAICSDKTGTLTTNIMSVVQGVVFDEEFIIDGYGIKPRTRDVTILNRNDPVFKKINSELIDTFCEALALNSTAREQQMDGVLQLVGNKTEHGLLGFCNLTKRCYKTIRGNVAEKDVRQFPFNSKKKRMTTIVRQGGSSSTVVSRPTLYVKGASEYILEESSHYADSEGHILPISPQKREEFLNQINDIAGQGNRTIAVGFKMYDCIGFPETEPEVNDYIYIGVLGIQDPIREEVPAAVQKCRSANITVRMVTGDNLQTAIAIVKKCHIYEDNNWDHAMTGREFRDMYNEEREELLKLVPRIRVLARSSPQDKYILVSLLQELGDVVGVTGDGTNDAAALRLSNVGFAMQIGTDIAKGAADMVLLDNNFASVVNAVKWGRTVNDNVRKFLQYQLSINFAGVVLTIVGSLASGSSKEPFSSVKLLWLNLIMDTLAALALATERPSEACLSRLPTYKQSSLLSRRMKAFIAIHGLYQFAVILVILFVGHWLFRIEEDEVSCRAKGGIYESPYCQQGLVHSTILFNVFIWFQIFNMFNARKLYGEHNIFEGLYPRSISMCVVLVIIIAFQIIAVELGGSLLETTGLSPGYWGLSVGIGATEWIIGVIVRLIPLTEPIPREVQEAWDHENKLRQARLVKPIERRESLFLKERTIIPAAPDLSLSMRRSSMIRK